MTGEEQVMDKLSWDDQDKVLLVWKSIDSRLAGEEPAMVIKRAHLNNRMFMFSDEDTGTICDAKQFEHTVEVLRPFNCSGHYIANWDDYVNLYHSSHNPFMTRKKPEDGEHLGWKNTAALKLKKFFLLQTS